MGLDNFDVIIGQGNGEGQYPITVQSPDGEYADTISISEIARQAPSFLETLPQGLWDLYRQCDRNFRLRWRFTIEPQELAWLPVELLHCPSVASNPSGFFALDPSSPVVRYHETGFEPVYRSMPLRILMVVPNPQSFSAGVSPLQHVITVLRGLETQLDADKVRLTVLSNIDAEGQGLQAVMRNIPEQLPPPNAARLSQSLTRWVASRWVQFLRVHHVTWQEFCDVVNNNDFYIIEYLGHSDGKHLFFESEAGTVHAVDPDDMALLLKTKAQKPVLVIHGCDSSFLFKISTMVQGGIPAVIAWCGEVLPAAATCVTRNLYGSWVARTPIDLCVTQARLALKTEFSRTDLPPTRAIGEGDWAKLKLVTTAPDGEIWTLMPAIPEPYKQEVINQCTYVPIPFAGVRRVLLERVFVEPEFFKSLEPAGVARAIERTLRDPSADPRRPARSLREMLVQHPFLILEGKPGSGKTTVAKYIALSCAKQRSQKRLGLDDELLPVFIHLVHFSRFIETPQDQATNLKSFMESPDFHFHFPEGFLEEYLNRGKCIVILDGLDEIKDNNLLNVSRKISEFVNRYVTPERGNRCVLCSRPTTLEEVRNLFDASAICQIQDFDEKLEGTRNLEHRFDESCEGGEECVE